MTRKWYWWPGNWNTRSSSGSSLLLHLRGGYSLPTPPHSYALDISCLYPNKPSSVQQYKYYNYVYIYIWSTYIRHNHCLVILMYYLAKTVRMYWNRVTKLPWRGNLIIVGHSPLKLGMAVGKLKLVSVSENAVFRDGIGNFEFTIVMYHPDNGQRSYKPQTKHSERMILPGSSQKCSRTYH